MGYSYDALSGQLCCDHCGNHGGVRRVNCTYGYCQAMALCAACRKNTDVMGRFRQHCRDNCKAASAEYDARKAAEQAVLDAGHYAFCVSVYVNGDTDLVNVTFRNSAGDTREMVVTSTVRAKLDRTSTYEYAVALSDNERFVAKHGGSLSVLYS